MKKKIMIIEDNLDHWSTFHNWLSAGFDCFPADPGSFKTMRSKISTIYGASNKPSLVDSARDYVKKKIEEFNPDVLVIDYELKTGDDLCNGIRFDRDFSIGKPVLFVNGISENDVKNRLNDYGHSRNASVVFKTKEMNENFRQIFMEKINQLLLIPDNACNDQEFDSGTL